MKLILTHGSVIKEAGGCNKHSGTNHFHYVSSSFCCAKFF